MNKKKHVFFFAGELSSDMHGARLIRALRKQQEFIASGVGGPEMRSEGIFSILNMKEFSVMGFSDVIRCLPRLWRQYRLLREHILKQSPNQVIFIDSPSFSLRMAKDLRKRGYRGQIVQYICPTVWAYGKERISQLAAHFDLLLTIYPFEAACFSGTSLRVEYVGNPIVEMMNEHRYASDKQKKNTIAIFPGSREGEIRRNLPKQLKAAKIFAQKYPETIFLLSCPREDSSALVQELFKVSNAPINVDFISKERTYDAMRSCRCAIAKSGTVTLELALHQCPTVVVYELSFLNRLFAKYILKLKLPFYCIVNILAGKHVFPELIETGFTAENLASQLFTLYEDNEARQQCVASCQQLRELFPETNTSQKAADIIQKL